ncbi:MAG: nucleotidyltransferase domain-containing protein [Chitinophagaceae bacterium]|nr:nucleotidyltransferase domain-containing protein [Chitinophagaceae bacterium]
MLTKKCAINKVKRFAGEIAASGIRLKKVVLFGSFAHGKTHEWSDIDVALAADEFTRNPSKNLAYFVRINNRKPFIRISTRTYNTKDFTPRVDPFVEVIMEHGIEINFKATH